MSRLATVPPTPPGAPVLGSALDLRRGHTRHLRTRAAGARRRRAIRDRPAGRAGDLVNGYDIPPGSDVAVSAWVTHRHPDFWDAPARFDPERFAPEREAGRHRHAYFPFGAGPRACIGQYFSMLEAAIALAVIVRDYELTSLGEHVPLAPRITLHPAAPVRCRLTPRRA